MKKTVVSFAIAVIAAVAMLAGCAPEGAQAEETVSPVPQTEQAEPTAEAPAAEPVFTPADPPEDAEIPAFYFEVVLPGVENRVFAFTDSSGSIQFRIYGVMSIPAASGETASESAGSFPAEVNLAGEDENGGPLFSIKLMDGVQGPVQAEDEDVGAGAPTEPDGGVPIPEGFEPVDGVAGLFSYSPKEGEVQYYSYCEFSEGAGGFYPADETGAVAPGSLPVTLDEDGNECISLHIDGESVSVEPAAAAGNAGEEDAAGDGDTATPRPQTGGGAQRPTPTPTPTPTPDEKPTPTPFPTDTGSTPNPWLTLAQDGRQESMMLLSQEGETSAQAAGAARLSSSATAAPEAEDSADAQDSADGQDGAVQEGPGRKIGLLIGGIILLLAAGYFFLLSWKRREKN